MFPWVYGFTWQAGNIIFLAVFYSVVGVISLAFIVASVRAIRDLKSNRMDIIRWHVDFAELPDSARICRHSFISNTEARPCMNGFDCRACKVHLAFDAKTGSDDPQVVRGPFLGLQMPAGYFYHRGHTWVRVESDGKLSVGLDDFGRRLIGRSARAELPAIGTRLVVNGTGWIFRRGDSVVRVLSPVDGEVESLCYGDEGCYLILKPEKDRDMRHLLSGAEIRPWITRELERLQALLSTGNVGLSLADGGQLVDDMPANYPDVDWEDITAEMFLEP